VEVSFLVNADGILVVKAKELRSGVEQSIEVTPQYGLTDEEVEKMLLDSITNAQADIATRALVEARTEAQQLISTTDQFLQKNEGFVTTSELSATRKAMETLAALLTSGTKDELNKGIEALNEISRPYAERLMDESIRTAIKVKRITENNE
jgi:molecular chaperone HscA